MTNADFDSYDAFRQMEYTRAALSALSEMTSALMSQDDGLKRHALGFEVLMDTQNEKLKEIEDKLREHHRSSPRQRAVREDFEREQERYRREHGVSPETQDEEAPSPLKLTPDRVQEIAAELRLNAGTVQRVIDQLQATNREQSRPEAVA